MIIDCHNHVLATAQPGGHERFIREMRSPRHEATRGKGDEGDWTGLEHLWAPIDPGKLIDDHVAAGVDRATVLAVAPSTYTAYGERGTIDLAGVTDVPGPLDIAKSNDYIAAITRQHEALIGMAAVNPRHRGVRAARQELRRAIEELGLTGLKLYPMYDHYAADDRDLAFPIFEQAADLGIGVMVHMGTSPARDTVLEYAKPGTLDDVARRFPDLRLLACHVGTPWVEDCLAVAARHPNMYVDVSWFATECTQRQLYDFLQRARQVGCAWSKICWGTDYPGGGTPRIMLPRFALLNDVAEPGAEVPETDMARFLGGNWARFAGFVDWSEEETVGQLHSREGLWRTLAKATS